MRALSAIILILMACLTGLGQKDSVSVCDAIIEGQDTIAVIMLDAADIPLKVERSKKFKSRQFVSRSIVGFKAWVSWVKKTVKRGKRISLFPPPKPNPRESICLKMGALMDFSTAEAKLFNNLLLRGGGT